MYEVRHPRLTHPISRHHKSEVAIEKAQRIPLSFVVNVGRFGHLTHVWSEKRPQGGGYVNDKDQPVDQTGKLVNRTA